MKFFAVCAVLWLIPGGAFSDTGGLSDYLLVKIKENASLYNDGQDNYCIPNYNKMMRVSGHAVVYAKYMCQENGLGEPMYLVAYRGNLYKLKQGDVIISSEYKEKLDRMPNFVDDAEKSAAKEKAIQDSKTFFKYEKILALEALEKTSSSGVAIAEWSFFDESEYTEGTSFKVRFYNPSKKTIKYVNLTALGLNAVGDPVRASGGSTHAVLRGIGPIEPGEFGTYKKAYAWPTDTVQRMRIVSVKVEYMNGTSSIVNNVNGIIMKNSVSELLSSLEDD